MNLTDGHKSFLNHIVIKFSLIFNILTSHDHDVFCF